MIRYSVFYPSTPRGRFDYQYYAETHMKLVEDRLRPLGLLRYEIDRGVSSANPDDPAPYVAVSHLYFNSVEERQNAFAVHGEELIADMPRYTDIDYKVQISEIVT